MIRLLQTYWQRTSAYLDSRKQSERVLLLVAVIALAAFLADAYFFQPLQIRQKALNGQIEQLNGQVAQAMAQQAEIRARAARDPNAPLRRQIEQLFAQQATVDARLDELGTQFISPQERATLLRQVLEQHRQLKLVEMVNLSPDLVFDAKEVEAGTKPRIYRHGLSMTLQGSYLDAVAYLQALEALPWRFLWDSVAISTETYPTTVVTITLYTLSLDERWIGV